MKAEDIRTKTLDELGDDLASLKKEQFNLRFQAATGQLEKTARIREVRRDIARIKTIAAQKRAAEAEGLRRERCRRRLLQGIVVSDKADKTVVVDVERRFTHPILKKTVRRTKKYQAHDPENQFKVGDRVTIEEVEADLQDQELGRGRRGKRCRLSGRESENEWRRASPVRAIRRRTSHDDPDADEPRCRGQFRRAPGAVHQGAGRLEAEIRPCRRHHRGVGEGSDSARAA